MWSSALPIPRPLKWSRSKREFAFGAILGRSGRETGSNERTYRGVSAADGCAEEGEPTLCQESDHGTVISAVADHHRTGPRARERAGRLHLRRSAAEAARRRAAERYRFGERWDLKFVHRCGFASHYDQPGRASSWPIPVDLTHDELAAFGAAERITRDEPAPGDVFLTYCEADKRYIQAGVIASIQGRGRYDKRTPYFDLYTIVGDTDETGRPGRGRAMRLPKRLSPAKGDRFLRWADCEANGGMIRYNRSTFLRDSDTPEAT